jgi:hypothetical protein
LYFAIILYIVMEFSSAEHHGGNTGVEERKNRGEGTVLM